MWPMRTKPAFLLMKRIRCWPVARTVAERSNISASKNASAFCTETFSKAFGALGGFVAGSSETLNFLRFYSHPYVYSCALPPVVIAAILKALEIGTSQPELRTRLWENADYFHKQLSALGIDTGTSTTYIMPIIIGDRERMYRLGHELRRRGLWVAPVDYPAVPQGSHLFPRLRDR